MLADYGWGAVFGLAIVGALTLDSICLLAAGRALWHLFTLWRP